METENREEITEKSEEVVSRENDVKENKDTAAASYFLILSPLLLITRKDSKFIQHHASQAFILFLIFLLLWFLGSFFVFFSWLTVGVFFMALVGFIQAISGDWYKIPYIYEMVKDGITFDGIVEGGKKAFFALKKMVQGVFPKKTENQTENNKGNETIHSGSLAVSSSISSEKEKKLEQRIEKLEKLLEQKLEYTDDKQIEFTKLSQYTKSEENKIKKLLSELSEKDNNAEVEKTESFYLVSGSFGEVKVGVQKGEVVQVTC